ncbi:calcium-binding EF-hand family protein [Actinidia rufa]|uniref:Calcium-binding EF-hand family protein n=1 Tax=Actinidia rufa TaxID=165716 RepID=A0A7J0EIJ9_9ERIC|nr:calcium-binding EF-hand family protein [Actinidia rufa]
MAVPSLPPFNSHLPPSFPSTLDFLAEALEVLDFPIVQGEGERNPPDRVVKPICIKRHSVLNQDVTELVLERQHRQLDPDLGAIPILVLVLVLVFVLCQLQELVHGGKVLRCLVRRLFPQSRRLRPLRRVTYRNGRYGCDLNFSFTKGV